MVHKGSAEPWVLGTQDLQMDREVALDTARLLAPKTPLALLRTLESSHRPHLAPEEAHHHC